LAWRKNKLPVENILLVIHNKTNGRMRAKVVLPVLALSLLLIAIAFVLNHANRGPSEVLPATQERSSLPGPPGEVPSQPKHTKPVSPGREPPIARSASGAESAPADHASVVAERVAELNRLAMTSDPGSLDTILSELSNHDPAIRMAAVSATIDFGSRDAVPALQNALGWTDELKEKMEIQRAIDFLQQPSALAQDHTSEPGAEKK
jgi:hypothetical protein